MCAGIGEFDMSNSSAEIMQDRALVISLSLCFLLAYSVTAPKEEGSLTRYNVLKYLLGVDALSGKEASGRVDDRIPKNWVMLLYIECSNSWQRVTYA
jgi:hypothetical protein